DVTFERLTVFAGQNGSGKTSLLEGIELLTRVLRTSPRYVFRGAADVGVVASRGAVGAFGLRLAGEWAGRPGAVAIRLDGIEASPFSDRYVLESAWGERIYSQRCELWSDKPVEEEIAQSKHVLADVLPAARFLRFDARKLALACARNGSMATVDEEGFGL